jgi:hypothetical protein
VSFTPQNSVFFVPLLNLETILYKRKKYSSTFILYFLSMKHFKLIVLIILSAITFGQAQTKSVLFLGNSYTYVNNLPQMLSDVANSTGDTVLFDSNTPGGYTLQGHSGNTTSLSKIAAGNWDFVVLQEQSQLPSFPDSQVELDVFPYARFLDSTIRYHNPCGETVFYMTWGRKNGDASNCAFWPPVCTYLGMDSLLNLRYHIMADTNNAILSPVGAVWKYIRQNYPLINLYQPDESHPSVAGTYAAACTFYTTIFRKDPTTITFNSTLSAADATAIKDATKNIVYNALLNWHIGEYDPLADFNYLLTGTNEITFSNTSVNAASFFWDFGDGATSTSVNPIHTYSSTGSYVATLISTECGISDSITQVITVLPMGLTEENNKTSQISCSPNPANAQIIIKSTNEDQLCIYTILGEILFTQKVKEITLDISNYPKGVYFIRNEKGNAIKFVKE